MCFPLLQTVSGIVEFDVRLMLHNNPGRLYRLEIGPFVNAFPFPTMGMNFTCSATGESPTCETWVKYRLDTTKAANDGLTTLRVKPRVVLSDGNVMLTSGDWPMILENGKPDNGRRDYDLVSRGWYTDWGYANPVVTNPEILLRPWRGTETLCVNNGAPSGLSITHTRVALDPNIHAGIRGTVLFERSSSFKGCFTIDTTRFADGTHTLMNLAQAKATRNGITGTNAGVNTVRIVIDNEP